MFKTLRSRVIASYFIVVLLSLLLASAVFVFFLSRYIRDSETQDLTRQVSTVARDIERAYQLIGPVRQGALQQSAPQSSQPLATNPEKFVQQLLNGESQVLKAKLAMIDSQGNVVAEASARPTLGERQLNIPSNLLSREGPRSGHFYFSRLGRNYLLVTAPLTLQQGAEGYLIAVKTAETAGGAFGSLIWYVVFAGLIALALSMLPAIYLSNAISRPVRSVTEAARRMAAGDYNQEVPVEGSDETAELARDFNMMADRVRTAYELQRNFVGEVSHELRTPLTSIEGFSQALLDGVTEGEAERRRSLEIINQESKRLVRLLRDLLLLSQIDAGELRPESSPVDLVDLARKMEGLYSARAEGEGMTLKVEPPPVPLTLNTDPDRLERVLTNLLDNAMKYAGSGGTVTLTVTPDAGWVHISVADSGPGIPGELLPSIFERFYRVEKSRATKHGGAGLGLSICKELVESLGGRITVHSAVGRGTTFTVTLPR